MGLGGPIGKYRPQSTLAVKVALNQFWHLWHLNQNWLLKGSVTNLGSKRGPLNISSSGDTLIKPDCQKSRFLIKSI